MSGKELPKALTKGAISDLEKLPDKTKEKDTSLIVQLPSVKNLLVDKPNSNMKYR